MASNSCITAQNFCTVSCQKGAELVNIKTSSLKLTDTNGLKQYDKITPLLWEKTYNILKQFHDKGSAGDRNFPSQDVLDNLNNIKNNLNNSNYEIITKNLYTKLLNAILLDADGDAEAQMTNMLSNFDTKQIIQIENVVDNIQNFLENYKIDFNRCNTCNATGNCSHCSHCSHTITPTSPTYTYIPIFCLQFGCGNSCDHGGSCSQCCMYGSPGSSVQGVSSCGGT